MPLLPLTFIIITKSNKQIHFPPHKYKHLFRLKTSPLCHRLLHLVTWLSYARMHALSTRSHLSILHKWGLLIQMHRNKSNSQATECEVHYTSIILSSAFGGSYLKQIYKKFTYIKCQQCFRTVVLNLFF